MRKLFFEKYSTKLEVALRDMIYSHKLQRNFTSNQTVESTITKSEGEASNLDDMIYASETTSLTKSMGESTDVDEIFISDSTKGSDVEGEATDDDDYYFIGATGTRAPGESEEDEHYA